MRPAPRFNIVEKPNDWAKAVKASEGASETERMRLSYWQRCAEIVERSPGFRNVMRPQKPSMDQWNTIRIGSSSCYLALLIYANGDKIGVGVNVPDNKEIGERVVGEARRLGQALDATPAPFGAAKASGVRFFKKGCNFKKHPEKRDEYIRWQLDAALKLRELVLERGL